MICSVSGDSNHRLDAAAAYSGPTGNITPPSTIADGAGATAVGHGYTYSAHPVSAAVALEVLRLYEGGLLENGRKAGARLLEGLRSLGDHPLVGDYRHPVTDGI